MVAVLEADEWPYGRNNVWCDDKYPVSVGVNNIKMELAKAVQFNIPIEWSISKKVDYLEQKCSKVRDVKVRCAKYITSGIDVNREVAFLQIKECNIGIKKIEIMLKTLKRKRVRFLMLSIKRKKLKHWCSEAKSC